MLKQIRDFLLQAFALAHGAFGHLRGRPTTLQLRFLFGQFFPLFGDSTQNRFGQFFDNVEFTNLVWHIAKESFQWLWIKGRTIGGNALQDQCALLDGIFEPAQERFNVLMLWCVIEYLVDESFEGVIVNYRQDAEWSIV